MRRVKRKNLQEAWMELSVKQRGDIIEEIASHVETLTAIPRFRYESVDGCGLLDFFHMKDRHDDLPTWRLNTCTLGPFSIPEFVQYRNEVTSEAALPELDENEPFVLLHADLDALNIMIRPNGEGITIIDWESVGFFPKYWVTITCISYRMEEVPKEQEMDYKNGLKAA